MIDRESLQAFIDRVVILENFPSSDSLDSKIELLCFALEELKYMRGSDSDEVSFEKYVQSEVSISGNKLLVSAPPEVRDIGSGKSPIQLQSSLLLFLLLNHKERYQVLDIIRYFVDQLGDQLAFIDFKKTKTGVTRCFTNTRFAAKVLREYGLLKFTRDEAFKTWELSMAGILVAASILQQRAGQKCPWYVLGPARDGSFDLLREIRDACRGIASYDEFVARLALICEPDAAIFKTFEPALRQAFGLLQGYWALLNDQTKSQEERRDASLERIKQLDALDDKFFQELSRCIQINDLLSRSLQTRNAST